MHFLPTTAESRLYQGWACQHAGLLLACTLASIFVVHPTLLAANERIELQLQHSALAGSQYYALSSAWPDIREGDPLTLVREPGNRHDRNAIRIEWNGRQLGYVPRSENRVLAAAMDRGQRFAARVSRLRQHRNPWQRVEFEVYLLL